MNPAPGHGMAAAYFGVCYRDSGLFLKLRCLKIFSAGTVAGAAPEGGPRMVPCGRDGSCGGRIALAWLEFGRSGAKQIGFVERFRRCAGFSPRDGTSTVSTSCS